MSRLTPAAPLAASAHRPLTLDQARITGGPLAEWQRRNAEATLPHAIAQLEDWGSIENFRIAAGESGAQHRGMVFIDSDVHKTIEAIAWEIGRSGTTAFDAWLDEVIALMARAQGDDGYLDTWIQVVQPDARWRRMEHNHEFYVLATSSRRRSRSTARPDAATCSRSPSVSPIWWTICSGPGGARRSAVILRSRRPWSSFTGTPASAATSRWPGA